jgi:hypothetical protein
MADKTIPGDILSLQEITTPTSVGTRGAIYPKSDNKFYFQDGAGIEHQVSLSADHYAAMNVHGNDANPTVIGEKDTPIGARGLIAGTLSNFTFDAGSTGPIASFVNAAGGNVTVGDVGHGLEDGEVISISGTTNYNGVFTVQNKADDTFEITHSDDGDDATGDWYQGSHLIVGAGGDGDYISIYTINASSGGANKEFEWHLFKNAVQQNDSHINHDFLGAASEQNVSGNAIIALAENDIVWVGVTGLDDGTNITHISISVTIHKF